MFTASFLFLNVRGGCGLFNDGHFCGVLIVSKDGESIEAIPVGREGKRRPEDQDDRDDPHLITFDTTWFISRFPGSNWMCVCRSRLPPLRVSGNI